jgi:FkbM family methyltransferase
MKKQRRQLYLALRRLFGRERLVYAPHGVPVQVPRDVDLKLRYELARGRPYEAGEAEMVKAYLRPGMSVIELGGCIGIISALIRNQIGPEACHIVVEANPKLARLCKVNAEAGAAPGATQVVVAAVDYSGAATVSFDADHSAHGGHVSAEGGLSVPTITLTKLAAALPPGPFALVCDIEGAECSLMDHEPALLERISTFIVETHPDLYANGMVETQRLIDLAAKHGLRQVAQVKNVYAFQR